MKSILKIKFNIIPFMLCMLWGQGVWGQTTYDWQTTAPDGNWKRGINNGPRWNPGTYWDEPPFGILRFNNSHQPNMNNNVSGTYSQHALSFDNSSVRTIGGNTVRLFDSGGADPYIRNNSTGTHVLNFNLEGDGDGGDPLLIQINNSGGFTFGGTINNRGSNINIEGERSAAGSNVTFNGVISGSGGLFKANSNITVVFNAANTFSGTTTIEAGTLQLGIAGASFGSSASAIRIGADGILNLNGFSTTVRYITERGTGDSGIVNLGSGTLTIADNGSTTRFQSSINGTGNIIYNSASTSVMSLFNSQGWSGSTTVQGGTLTSAGAMQTTSIIISGGTFRTTGSDNRLAVNPPVNITGGTFNPRTNETISSLTGSGGTVDINTGNTLTVNNTENNEYGGLISGAGGLIKTGTATLTLTNQNTYTGTTTVNEGELNLNRTGENTLVATNNVIVNGGTLRVSSNQTLNNLTIESAAQLIVPNGVTLTINGTLTINSNFSVDGSIVFGPSASVNIRTGSNFTNLAEYWPASNGPVGVTLGNNTSLSLDGVRTLTTLSVESGSTLNLNNNNLTISSGGTIANAGTLTVGSGKVIFSGSATISGNSTIQFGDVDISGGVNFGSNSRINGNLRILPNGFFQTYQPNFANNSILSFETAGQYNLTDSLLPSGSGENRPYDIVIVNSSVDLTVNDRTVRNDLRILSGGVFRSGTNTITVFGNLVVEGEYNNGTSGTVTVNGNLQTASGSTLSGAGTISITNSAMINTGATLSFTGNFLYGANGRLVIEGSGDFTTTNSIFPSTNGPRDFEINVNSGTVTMHAARDIAQDLIVTSGALSVADNTAIGRNFTINEGASATVGQNIRFNGASAQSIAGLAYNNIEFSNGGIKTFTSNASVSPTSAVTFTGTPGTVDFDGSSNNLTFTLLSDVNGTARVANATGWTLNGRVNTQRYLPARRAWRFLTAPVTGNDNNTIYFNWQNNGDTENNGTGVNLWSPNGTGNDGNGLVAGGGAPNIYKYTTQTPAAWVAITNTKDEALFTNTTNNAFMVFVTGGANSTNINSGAFATTMVATGTLRTGEINYGNLPDNIHTLIGNPYASPISPLAVLNGNPGFRDKLWVLDPQVGSVGQYVIYDKVAGYTNTSGSYQAGTNIQSGQAFFVRRSSLPANESATFTITEAHKASAVDNSVFNRNATQSVSNLDKLRVSLWKNTNTQWQNLDAVLAAFYPEGNNAIDMADGGKINGVGENLALMNGTSAFTLEHRATAIAQDVLPLRVSTMQEGANYQLRVQTDGFNNPNVEVFLHDTFTNTFTAIPTDDTLVTYPFAVTSTAASTGNRFQIVFQNSPLSTQNTGQLTQAVVYPNPVNEGTLHMALPTATYQKVALYNALGQMVYQQNVSVTTNLLQISTKGLADGYYQLHVEDQQGQVYKAKVIIQ